MMLKGLTAQYLLRQTYRVKEGDTILVHAAAGGVGLILCQWGKALGATVIGCVGSAEKAALAKKAGAKHTILYRDEDFAKRVDEITKGAKCHVVYDGVGKATFPASLDCLRPFGVFASFGSASGGDRGVQHRSSWRRRARCSRPGRPCSPSWRIAPGPRKWRATCSASSSAARSRSRSAGSGRSPRPLQAHIALEKPRNDGLACFSYREAGPAALLAPSFRATSRCLAQADRPCIGGAARPAPPISDETRKGVLSRMIEPSLKSAEVAVTPAKKEEGWWETVKVIIEALLIALVVRTVLFQPFNIPSGSLVPTLLVGDYLFVSKYAYGYSHFSLPSFLDLDPQAMPGRIFASEPKRGDIIVFKLPSDGQTDYIKRLIGLPGDKIQVLHGRLIINGEKVPREPIAPFLTVNHFNKPMEAPQYLETLPGGVQHRIIQIDGDEGTFDNTKVYEVPPGHYFMMGDNRDNSSNSRLAGDQGGVGYVPFENLIGRAEVIFFSIDEGTPAWEVWRWPWTVRWSRIFQRVR